MNSNTFFYSRVVSLFLTSFFFISCGKQKPMVKDVLVSSSYIEDDLHLGLDAQLSIGNINLPNATVPVLMPRTLEQIGYVQMRGGVNLQNSLKLKLNISEISKLESSESTLPNGVDLPVIAKNRVIEIPVANRLKVYVSIGDSVVALGVAVPFKTFDRIGDKVGTSAIFPTFFIKDVIGSAGIYTSKDEGENGFAFFADVSNSLDRYDFLDLNGGHIEQLQYIAKVPTENKKRKIDYALLKFHRQRKQLRLY